MITPLGKRKGSDLHDVPPDYCLWVLKKVIDNEDLKKAIRHRLLHAEDRLPRDRAELEAVVRSVVEKMSLETLG